MGAKPEIVATGLSVGYNKGKEREKVIHTGLSFKLYPGELTCLLGPNGAGKSTLLRTLSGSQPALAGEILIQEKPVSSFSERELSRKIGVVYTDNTQAGGLTVYEVVALGRYPHTGFFGRLHVEDRRIISQALEAVGIVHKAGNCMAELSDGERQKVMIAKALVQECPIILLDEPTAFLDIVSRIEIMSLLHEIAVRHQKTVLLSTHDIEQALVLADRLWLLSRDNGLFTGVTEDVVLSGRMELLFDHQEIKFDVTHGVYYPRVNWERTVALEVEDDTVRHWVLNIMNRHGYGCIVDGERSEEIPVLSVIPGKRLHYSTGGDNSYFSSFGELAEFLRDGKVN
ncbi:MAG: ABC transporter ATP-binding protein [Bacteroides sp.]|nr:ABC transporter ATP-binding protein [Bacteroides sp.]